jgi:hypothetical protein
MCFPKDKTASRMAAQQRSDELARQSRIQSGMSEIDRIFSGQFNPEFYGKQRQAYLDFATPQLDRQYGDTKDQLVYALSRSGLLDSSAGQTENANLSRAYDRNRLEIAGKAMDTENAARASAENARSNLVTTLNATGDDAATAAAALRQSQNLSMPQGYSPLVGLFGDLSSSIARIGSNAANDYSGLARSIGSLFKTGGRGSQTVVGG